MKPCEQLSRKSTASFPRSAVASRILDLPVTSLEHVPEAQRQARLDEMLQQEALRVRLIATVVRSCARDYFVCRRGKMFY